MYRHVSDWFDYILSFLTFKLNREFKEACIDMQVIRSNLSLQEYLELYALFKRSVYGKCHPTTQVDSSEKREYWTRCNSLSIRMAKIKYIEIIKSLKSKYGSGLSSFGTISKMEMCKDNESQNIFELINSGDSEGLIELLKENPSLVNIKGNDGMSLLHLAADRDRVCIVKVLLDFGLDVDIKDDFGDSPLDVANVANSKKCIEFLTNLNKFKNN